jgi:uncharacterized integral membrane protein
MSNRETDFSLTRTAKTVGITIAVIVLAIAVIQNTQVVTLRFLIWDFPISQILLIPLAALIGFAIGLIAYSFIAGRRQEGKETLPRKPE